MKFGSLTLAQKVLISAAPFVFALSLSALTSYRRYTIVDERGMEAIRQVDFVRGAELEMVKMSEALSRFLVDPKDQSQFELKKKTDADYLIQMSGLAALLHGNSELHALSTHVGEYDAKVLNQVEDEVARLVKVNPRAALRYYRENYLPARAVQDRAFEELKTKISANSQHTWAAIRHRNIRNTVILLALLVFSVAGGCVLFALFLNADKQALAGVRAKSDFLANVSHEIRTPMNSVLGMSDLLAATKLTSEQREYVEAMQGASKGLLRMVGDILDLVRSESGDFSLISESFSLRALVGNAVEQFRVQASQKGLELRVNIGSSFPERLVGDSARVQQILLNLIGNAVKFTSHGTVTVEAAAKGSSVDGTVKVLLSVTDTGPGISEDDLEKIFDRFTQVDSSLTRKHEGLGLGLTIVRKLAQKMEGDVSVTSRPGAGSRFNVELCLRSAAAISDETASSDVQELAWPKRPIRILLVDDHDENRNLIGHFLRGSPIELESVENGQVAVERICSDSPAKPFDLVLMDLQMPVMDGYTATKEIRRWERWAKKGRAHVPILALTAHALEHERLKSIQAGCDAHLTKPIHKKDLLKAILAGLASAGGKLRPF